MKILFVLKQRNYLATYAGVIIALTQRGHSVRLAWPDSDASLPEELSSLSVSIDMWEPKRADEWAPLVGIMRRGADYLRYLEPSYSGARKLRARAFEKLLHSLSRGTRVPEQGWSEIGLGLTGEERERLLSVARLIEHAIPSDTHHDTFIASDRPDVVLVSPLIDLGSAQTDIIKSAKRLGIPTGMILYSWDNLSTKGGLHIPPDRMFVWNELQRKEAATLHGYPLEQTIATGAPRFDDFFRLAPTTDRESFHGPLGLDPRRRSLMYVGSSKFVITGSELPYIREWVRELRRSDDNTLRNCNIIIRPHPDVKAWDDEGPIEMVRWDGLAGKGQVTRPIDDERVVVLRTHYRRAHAFYDALHHSAAVVGLNTSAALEAAIVGRPVFTILAGEDAANGQSSTLHFHYLLEENGGCVTLSTSFDEHRRQLAAALAGPDQAPRLRAFATAFVRPAGLELPASDVLAASIEREFGGMHAAPLEPSMATSQPDAASSDAPAPRTVRLDFPGTDIWLHTTSPAEQRWRAMSCAKEPWTVEWILQEVHKGEVLYDIGANVGTFSLIAAKHCGALAVAFEPGYASFARLCENIHLNGCSRTIVPVPLPLADKTGLVSFKYRSLDPGQSRHHLRDTPWSPGSLTDPGARFIQPVCAMTLDAVYTEFGLSAPHHLKIDVDGAELRVLRGATAVLRCAQLRTILVEADTEQWEPVHELLTRSGFVLRSQHKWDHKPHAPTYAVFARG
jgi:FkbM family methyltransferase